MERIYDRNSVNYTRTPLVNLPKIRFQVKGFSGAGLGRGAASFPADFGSRAVDSDWSGVGVRFHRALEGSSEAVCGARAH